MTIDEEIQVAIESINRKRVASGVPSLSNTEIETVKSMADDPWGHIYDPRPVYGSTGPATGDGYLNEYD